MAKSIRIVLIAAMCAGYHVGASASADRWPRVALNDAVARDAVHTLMDDVVRWISEPRCQTVLERFRDTTGYPLTQRLARTGVSFDQYLNWVFFRDGSELKACAHPQTFAVTEPGNRVVFLCTPALNKLARHDHARAKAVLIHEILHTLGLGENGVHPTSDAITRLVLARCQK